MEQTKVADFSQLIASMTLDEKIGMIHGSQLFRTAGISRLGIPPLTFSDGTMGVRQEFLPDSWEILERNDDYVTYLPCAAALAASWNRELAEQTGSVLGEEARGRGKDVILSPGMNLKRSPLCGRNFEYFSEDPYLTGQMAVPYIKGIQKWDVAACTKHFAANNQETDRLQVEAEAVSYTHLALRYMNMDVISGFCKKIQNPHQLSPDLFPAGAGIKYKHHFLHSVIPLFQYIPFLMAYPSSEQSGVSAEGSRKSINTPNLLLICKKTSLLLPAPGGLCRL